MKKHDHDFDLPYYENENVWKKIPRTPDNFQIFKDKLVETTLNGKKIERTYRTYEKCTYLDTLLNQVQNLPKLQNLYARIN